MLNFAETLLQIMKESLESARNIHQIIIVVCAVVAGFSISLKPELNKFETALLNLQYIEYAFYEVNNTRVDRIKKEVSSESEKIGFEFPVDSAYKYKTISSLKSELRDIWYNLDSLNVITADIGTLDTLLVENKTIPISGLALEPHPSSPRWKTERLHYYDCDYIQAFWRLGLFKSEGSADSLFANFKPVWKDVKDLPFEDAKLRLIELSNQEQEKEKGNFDLSGLPVAGENMYIIGPCALITLLAYLLSLVLHLKSLIRIKQNAEDVSEFPWMALFPNFYSRFLSFFSLFLLPVAVSGFLVIKSRLNHELLNKMLLCYAFLFIVIAGALVYQILTIQRRVHQMKR